MASGIPLPANAETVLLFGSQALDFDQHAFRQLSTSIVNSPDHAWALRTIDELPELWETICNELPQLRTAPGVAHLSKLGSWVRKGKLETAMLPNTLLSPLVVIVQLTQYAAFAAMREEEALPPSETAYVSVAYDDGRASVTASRRSVTGLRQELEATGFTVTEIGLRGRFHTERHGAGLEALTAFCASHPEFTLPDAATLKTGARSNSGQSSIANGPLHDMALKAILLEKSRWYATFAKVQATRLADKGSRVICFGPERCIPPSLLRGLGDQVLYPEDVLSWQPRSPNDIAVVGMSINVAGADDAGEMWSLLAEGKSQHKPVPSERFGFETIFREKDAASRTWYGNFLNHHDSFDHKYFKKAPREAASMDPQQRLLLQAAEQALQQSGYFSTSAHRTDKHIGCFIGLCGTDYDNNIACHQPNAFTATGTLRSFIAGKVSHYFGWTGPGLTVDTACSSSAVAVHQACRAILAGECNAALAGGTNVMTQPLLFQNLAGASFLSQTGQCKPFDALADGYCRGEAIAAVFLKKVSAALEDGDQILGVIASTAVYQNQNCTPIVVPNSPSLSGLFRDTLDKSGLEPSQVSVVEAHGTGTPVGDPAEFDSVRNVFGGFPRPLQLGSVKGLVGHTEGTSGAVSLIKVLLMMQKGRIPPQASFARINPAISTKPADNIHISTHLRPWDVDFKAALINNYGASGSNASMLVTQAPRSSKSIARKSLLPAGISLPFWICGLDDRSTRAYASKLRAFLKTDSAATNVADASFNLARQSNRSLEKGVIFNCRSVQELEQKLAGFENATDTTMFTTTIPSERPVILCFGGQISTFVGLDRQVYENVTVLRNYLDRCDAMARKLDIGSIYPAVFQKEPIQDIVSLQTALFALQYSTAKSWIECGIRPAAVVGHSFGELTALCVSGALSLRDAMRIISRRAKIIRDNWGPDKGSMLACEADIEEVNKVLSDSGTPATVACFNGPRSHTIAGSTKCIDMVVETILKKYSSLRFKRLNVSNAFHSALVQPLIADLIKVCEHVTFHKPTIPVELCTQSASEGSFSTNFVADHLRNPVYFNHAIQRLAEKHSAAIWLEAGSNATVTSMASKALGASSASHHHFQAINISSPSSLQKLVDNTITLWRAGIRVAYWPHSKFQTYEYATMLMPPYQFDRQRHWLELKDPPRMAAALASHVEAQSSQQTLPTSLWTFTGYQDTKQRLARFRVNTMIPKYEEIVAGHTIAGTAPICPATVQIDIAIEAVSSLHTELASTSLLPQVRNVINLVPVCVDPARSVWLEVEVMEATRRTWSWRMTSTGPSGAAPTTHVTGEILFRRQDDLQYQLEFARYERLVNHKRCIDVLHSEDADEVMQGRSIYRAFASVVDYSEQYFGLQKLVGKGLESAGRVVKKHSGETWLDAFLCDAFCQVGGIWANCMTDKNPNNIFIANGIEQWTRSPKFFKEGIEQSTERWHVFGTHSPSADGSSFLSDLFVFDAKSGALAEVILGIKYAKVPRASMGKLLDRLTAPGAPAPAASASPAVITPEVTQQSSSPSNKKEANKDSSDISAELITKIKLILADISGLEVNEIKEDVELADIGVDSLMGMEMAREIETSFKCSLIQEELMLVTDFPSLLKCLKSSLGLENEVDSSDDSASDLYDSSDSGYTTPESVHTNATSPLPTPDESNSAKLLSVDLQLDHSTILEAFGEAKILTDKLIEEQNAQGYLHSIIPRQDQFCVALSVEVFRELGCDLVTAKLGQELPRIPHAPDQAKFAQYLYSILESSRLVNLDHGVMTRTHVAVPPKPSSELLKELIQKYPEHACSNELAYWTGSHLAGILTGKEDGIKLIFGTERGRELVSGVYADFPLNKLYYKQMGIFLSNLGSKILERNQGQGPLKILEMGAGTGATTKNLLPVLANLGIPVEYTFTDLAPSFIAAARKKFKEFSFVKFRVHDIEKAPAADLVHSQHIVIASNAIHATRSLPKSTKHVRDMLRPDGLLLLLEMTQPMLWCDIIFGVFEGWWLFEDGREHAVASPDRWERDLHSAGYGHVDWSDGHTPEVNLERVIMATASGTQLQRLPRQVPAPKACPSLGHKARRAITDEYIQESVKDFSIPLPSSDSNSTIRKNSVLITGASGSLGAHMVAHFANLPDVDSVVCLNRRVGGSVPEQRQHDSLRSKGISLDQNALSKLRVFEADISKSWLGLTRAVYEDLTRSVTHIVHNAWPMNAKKPLKTFEQQFQLLRNLLDFAADISAYLPPTSKVSFQLISSIATVGHYPLHTGSAHIPEERMTIESVLPNGYGDAKFTCERMLDETLHQHPDRFRTMVVRLGQVAGSTSSGYWNTKEHLSFLVKSSQTLRVLPALQGPLSWTPVDDVAAACADLVLADNTPHPVYHIDNPVRQPWEHALPVLARELDIPRDRIVPFEEWIRRVRAFPGNAETENPAALLVDFLEGDFVRMSCGGVLLETGRAREHSERMRGVGRVGEETMRRYIEAWKDSGFLF
ncbi:hypothetical protein EJ04DRAFT_587517 [Polyplosphaeria fusca]|uniref:Polyketide synthase n=1 Tax=Polyplosphaeria fusca TaxID=682080 RepID=A0A9P4UYC9_9PLEO|nr:hypothetical protein EJ04DRAFT_587517 [Polyplosphaeria fusca]